MNQVLKGQIIARFGTLYRFAKSVGVTPNQVSEIIHGRRGISSNRMLEWSLALGCSPEIFNHRGPANLKLDNVVEH
jgi:plasmid maintenance system antidote protein VapI